MLDKGDDYEKHKSHRASHSGRKADKKKEKEKEKSSFRDGTQEDAKKRNVKAFAINSTVKAERRFRRTQDLISKKEHIPLVDRTPLEPPPFIVAIVGPQGVGKTSLMRCLIRNYTRHNL